MNERNLKAMLETIVRSSQANFDHLSGEAKEFAKRFNQLANDVKDLYELLGIEKERESNEQSGADSLIGPNLDLQEHTHADADEGGQTDHGTAHTAASLLDDDHTLYLKEKASGGTAAETPTHAHTGAAEAGQLDHGAALTGLTDDDHTQYLKEKLSGGTAAEVPEHAHTGSSEGGAVDHGALSSLTGDHDAEYINEGQAAGGALGGTYPNPTVDDDGHSHTGATIDESGIDHGSLAGLTDDDHPYILESLIDAVGDLIVGSADNTPARLAKGSDGQVLTVDSAEALDLKWATPAGGAGSKMYAHWRG